MARFTGKRVLITGGTSGIGLAGARRVTTEGGQLVLTGTNQQRLADMQEALPDAQVLRNDASDPSAANALADSVAAGGGLDGLWLNAGYAAVAGADEVDTDYVTREGLARAIAGEFWSKIEKIAPDQRTLNIPQEVYDQWREGIRLRKDGKPRVDGGSGLLLPVRAFYMDIQNWALEEPERWARWAAPCPIPPTDLRGFGARRGGSTSGRPTGSGNASRCCRRWSRTWRNGTRVCAPCSRPLGPPRWARRSPTTGVPTRG